MVNERRVVKDIARAVERLSLSGVPDLLSLWIVMSPKRRPNMVVVASILDEATPWIPTHVVIEPDEENVSFLITPVKCVDDDDDVVDLCYTSLEWMQSVDEPKWTVQRKDHTVCYGGFPDECAAIVRLDQLFGHSTRRGGS